MYTQVSFGLFLERVFASVEAEQGIEFGEYPNIAIPWREGDWLYEILGGFSVRIFRWLLQGKEVRIAGPDWNNLSEKRAEFEERFERDFKSAIDQLSNSQRS